MENLLVFLLLTAATTVVLDGEKPHLLNDLQMLTDTVSQIVDEKKMKDGTAAEISALREKLHEQGVEMEILKTETAKMAGKLKEYESLVHQAMKANEELKDTLTKQRKLTSILQKESEELKGFVRKQIHEKTIKEGVQTETERIGGQNMEGKQTEEDSETHMANITENMVTNMDQYPSNKANITDTPNAGVYNHHPKVKSRAVVVGEVAFSAYLSHKLVHITTGHTVKCDLVLTNVGNGYNGNTGVFSVPTTGFYLLLFNVATIQGQSHIFVNLQVDNRLIVSASADPGTTNHIDMGGNSAIVKLTAGESVWLEVYNSGNGEIESSSSFRLATFSGVLLL